MNKEFIKIFDTYLRPECVVFIEGTKSTFKIGLSNGTNIVGTFGTENGVPKHTVEDVVDAVTRRVDLIG